MRNLKTGEPVTIYLVLPPHYLGQYSRLFRLWITMAMASMTRSYAPPTGGRPVLFLLDEMAQLGTMDMMRKAVSLMAGYGMTLWMVWQDLSQLKLLYKDDWQSFLANAKVQQYFGINDPETAKTISEMLGEETIRIVTESESTATSKENLALFHSTKTKNTARSNAEAARALLKPDEVRRLPLARFMEISRGVNSEDPAATLQAQYDMIYAFCPILHEDDLQEHFACDVPTDIVPKIFRENMGSMNLVVDAIGSFYLEAEDEAKN